MLNLEISESKVVPPESLSFKDIQKTDGVYEAESGCNPASLIIISDNKVFIARYNGIFVAPKVGHGWENLMYRLSNKSAVFSNVKE